MKLAREGYSVIACNLCATVVLTLVAFIMIPLAGIPLWLFVSIAAVLWLLFAGVLLFFREPTCRKLKNDPDAIFSSADGRVVVIEEVYENEFLHRKCIQVSVFMSITNVHVNWFPVGGKVVYRNYIPGKFLVAWHPKSSEENERTTTVVDTGREMVLFRQIAGFVARRIVNHAKEGDEAVQNTKYGFIKFGSRIDIFIPLESEVTVKIGDRVRGGQTPLAVFKR